MSELGVNIDHVATLRQLRRGNEPDPVYAAIVCQQAGAHSIVAHLREDRRHIQEKDLFLLRQAIKVKFNLEMSIAQEIVAIACKLRPDQATLVPEKRLELTTEGGLDVISGFSKVEKTVRILHAHKVKVSIFIDPDKEQIHAAKESGAGLIELHTGQYADSTTKAEQKKNFKKLVEAADFAKKLGLKVFAGHGLNYHNVKLIAAIRGIEELNIGYSIICKAVFVGLEKAVRQMLSLIG